VLETLLLALTLQAAPVAGAAAVPAPVKPDSLLPTDPAVKIGTLPNGFRYYIRTNRKPEHRAELRLVVNAGSVLEDDDQRGLAHFVEHMAFNGTTNFKKQELIDYIERIGMRFGADLNAGTSFDETVYQLQVPTDSAGFLGRAFQILEDWAHGVTFDTTEIRKERGVVLEEWRMGRGARQRLLDQQLPVLFRGSRYATRLPIGTQECIQQCPPEALTRFYREWYRPDLMAVVAVGDFDPARVESEIVGTDVRLGFDNNSCKHFAPKPADEGFPEKVFRHVQCRAIKEIALELHSERGKRRGGEHTLQAPGGRL
jgi:zinc protease